MLRGLNQLARELLLATASDWPFMISMGTTVAYAESRVRRHINRFTRLLGQIENRAIDEDWLSTIEASDNIFPVHRLSRLCRSDNGAGAVSRRCGDRAARGIGRRRVPTSRPGRFGRPIRPTPESEAWRCSS